mmetsp:Transcript_260/g.551  ORF Transcript_260/g.551 Transcript_260/m.551 type:complete len:259 (+) Transcript_260:472-1248(+)
MHTKYAVSCGAPTTLIQAASQFNCLEMVGPSVTPESGITQYVMDRTQGPACALACPAGTLYRNYFYEGGQTQGPSSQINTLSAVDTLIGNPSSNRYYTIRNGYAIPNPNFTSLAPLLVPPLRLEVRNAVQAGVHWNTSLKKSGGIIAQIYCSACPVQYTKREATTKQWEPFARAVLEGMYVATLGAGARIARETGERTRVCLTLLGGGAFGNPLTWILDAIEASCEAFKKEPLDIILVHYSPYPKGGRFDEMARRINK